MTSSIGIKIANGEFYPLLEENSVIKKRLVLTTVHDNQPSVQIDLYRSIANSMADAQYIGSLVVENIKPKQKGEPSIEMVISSNDEEEIVAEAIDLDTSTGGEHYVLTVSLKSIDETSRDVELPDFELEANELPPSGLYHAAGIIREKESKRKPVGLFVLFGLLLLLGLLAAWLFLMGGVGVVRSIFDTPATEQAAEAEHDPRFEPAREPDPEPVRDEPVREAAREAASEEPVVTPPPAVTEPIPVIQAPVTPPPPRQPAGRGRNPPVRSFNVPSVIPREGVSYRIQWGDTLWDIAEAFYRDPWQYPRIARHNNIPNPNLIISGRTIRLPPRN
ncbi:MAG: LysM peptidoglycan-binding domain-containing protein [Treponema sp.]|nr:LysM peptidoglycan-binding domain-containing protein [Treponema sp.]